MVTFLHKFLALKADSSPGNKIAHWTSPISLCGSLTVTGQRSSPRWRADTPLEDSIITYHQRQILQGPYVVVWPLPSDVNRDSVSAELL